MSEAGKALLYGGWTYEGLCGTCKNRMKKWSHKEKGEIKISKKLGYFYHYVGNHNVKSDYTKNLATYLDTL